jgi:hypothetical protein
MGSYRGLVIFLFVELSLTVAFGLYTGQGKFKGAHDWLTAQLTE